ncbi:MAG: hypothetical protein ACI9YE_002784 [Psychroserpens sp.]|jgi:hypothetical protein
MKRLLVNNILYVLIVINVSCSDKSNTKNIYTNIDPCLVLEQVNSIGNRGLLLDVSVKSNFVGSLKSLGLSNYVMGTSKDKPAFIDSLLNTNSSFNEVVKIYHRFYNDSLTQQLVIFEMMKLFEDKKYNQTGELLIYLENGEDLNWHACTGINTSAIASSEKSSLFLK